MSGFDILFDRNVSSGTLQNAIATAMGIPSVRVAVIASVEKYPNRDIADCVCVVGSAGGQFPMHAAVDYREAACPAPPAEIAAQLAGYVECNCLISDDSANPYTMIYVTRQGVSWPVSLEVTALDERGEYNLEGRRGGS